MLKYLPQWMVTFKNTLVFLSANLVAIVSLAQVTVSGKVTGTDGNGIP